MSLAFKDILLSTWLLLLLGQSYVFGQTYPAVNDTTYEDEDVFRQDMLNTTNWFREQYNASELVWNDTLAEFAEEVVEECKFEHSVSSSILTFVLLLSLNCLNFRTNFIVF